MTLDCSCRNKVMVWTHIKRDGTPLADGTRVLRTQCQDCGDLGATSLPRNYARPNTPVVDVSAVMAWNEKAREYYERERMSFIKNGQRIKSNVDTEYQQYLMTEQWRAKRMKALQRANFVCEGCGDHRASEVHHLSYLHLGNEFLWELKAVCRTCHEKCHPDKKVA